MRRTLAISAIVFVAALTVNSSAAQASTAPGKTLAGIPIVYGYGDEIDDLGQCPAQPNLHVGFKYWSLNIFWMNLWTSGGEYVIYKDDGSSKKFTSLGTDRAEAESRTGATNLGKPFTYTFPPALLIFGGLILIGVISNIRKQNAAHKAAATPTPPNPK